MKFFGLDFEFQKDVSSFARMGRRLVEAPKKVSAIDSEILV